MGLTTDAKGTRKSLRAVRYGDLDYLDGFYAHPETDYMSYKLVKPGSEAERDLQDVIVYVEERRPRLR